MRQGWEDEGEAEAEDSEEGGVDDPESEADRVLNSGGFAGGISSH